MDRVEAQRRFAKADKLFLFGRYEDVLVELEALDEHYPGNHRLLNARARTLAKLGRISEALAICDWLLDEFQYEKIRPFREQLARELSQPVAQPAPPTQSGGSHNS